MRPLRTERSPQGFGALRAACLLSLGVALLLGGCGSGSAAKEASFVGKWQSSRLSTPLVMHANGEWEVLREDGSAFQFGVWQYADDAIVWSFKQDGRIGHDTNKVLSVTPKEFSVRERDGSTTVFRRLD